jgi:hypothetical protein
MVYRTPYLYIEHPTHGILGSKYHGKEVQYTLGRVIDIPWVGNSKPRVGVKIPLIEGLICHG